MAALVPSARVRRSRRARGPDHRGGVPLVDAFAVAELATALGLSADAGRRLVADALEIKHRLPRLWARVQAASVPAWKARRVAQATGHLSPAAAARVDRHLALVAGTSKPWRLDALVAEAIARHMPERAEQERRAALEGRHVTVHAANDGQVTFEGTSHLSGELDLSDALDLENALQHGAARLAALGSEESLDVRRSRALGEIARAQTSLDLAAPVASDETGGPQTGPRRRKARQVVLYTHVAADAVRGAGGRLDLARVEGHGPVLLEDLRSWIDNADVQVVHRPVLDLEGHVPAEAYEVPDRMQEQAALTDLSCVFPFCARPARRCDCDHTSPYDTVDPARGGPTCACNLAKLCRHHHRVKTHDHRAAGWAYTPLEPGSYLWRTPLGLSFLRDHRGTHDVTGEWWTEHHLPTRHLRRE